jgi:hypothetical protein
LGELPAAGAVDCAQTPTVMASANPARTAVLYPMRSIATIDLTSAAVHPFAAHGPASLYHLDASMFHFGNKGKAAFFGLAPHPSSGHLAPRFPSLSSSLSCSLVPLQPQSSVPCSLPGSRSGG